MRKAIFLDRDGTINVEKNYVHRVEDWEWIPGAIDAIKGFNNMGYVVIVVSNQSGIARKYYDEEDVKRLHKFVALLLKKEYAKIDAYYYCPHHPDFGQVCCCRKPKPGLIFKAQNDLDIDLSKSFMIGDKVTDIRAGKAAGVKPVLVMTGYGRSEMHKLDSDVPVVEDIYNAYELVKSLQ